MADGVNCTETLQELPGATFVPHPFTLKMESCRHPGTDYDDEARIITICYETPFDFAELYRVYVQPPPVAAAVAPAQAARSP